MANSVKDPYQILGVPKTASQDDIKSAYRNLAKKHHPDLNPGNKTAEAKFKDLSVAYERIGTPEARAQFDRGETQEQQQEQAQSQARSRSEGRGPFYNETQQDGGRYSYSFGGDPGSSEFFENLFRSQGREPLDRPGEDHLYQMPVDFKDAALGVEREISLPNGKRLHVKIPPGVETGSKLRFKNQGGPATGKGPAGDAYVEITVRPHHGFKRVGKDIETEVPVSFMEALLGCEIPVQTIDGSVMLKVPAGVNTGSKLRIRGKGVMSGETRGDQIVAIKVVMPKKGDPSLPGLEEAVRELSKKHSYNPREAL